MKKILILAGVSLFSINSAIAEQYYVRVDAGLNMLVKEHARAVGGKLKNENGLVVAAAIGAYLHDKVRGEVFVTVGNDHKLKSHGVFNFAVPGAVSGSEQHKIKNQNFMLRILPDLVDFGYGKFYVSLGAGISSVRNTVSITSNDGAGETTAYNAKSKPKYNPVYTIGAGSGFFLSETIMLDVAYVFIDSGNTKSRVINIGGTNAEVTKAHIRSHNFTVGVRVNL